MIPDDYFRDLHGGVAIVSAVATITLAEINKMTDRELERIGWYCRSVQVLYAKNSTGDWAIIPYNATYTPQRLMASKMDNVSTKIDALNTNIEALLTVINDVHDDTNNALQTVVITP